VWKSLVDSPKPALPRSAGILLHPTSLPGRFGIGELGDDADRFLDWLVAAGQQVWQVLPLGPIAYGNSPYASLSAFAGNPLLISGERLLAEGLLPNGALANAPAFASGQVDFESVTRWKAALLRRGWQHLRTGAPEATRRAFEEFREAREQAFWLDDWCLYSTIKEQHGGLAWVEWEPQLRHRDSGALAAVRRDHADEIAYRAYLEFVFRQQWQRVKAAAEHRGVRIVGDLPIYVAHDCADVWAHPEWFTIDGDGRPEAVAGVPPDYFSDTGQLWGNPLYRWGRLARRGYRWWIERIGVNLDRVHYLRLDHFRGFVAFWRVPGGEETAMNGRWIRGPGAKLFAAIREALGELPFIAEDLGVITPAVNKLRKELELPGMKVLQFGFDTPRSPHSPGRIHEDDVVYTGTHDNDTTRGWYETLDAPTRARVLKALGSDGAHIAWDMIRAAHESPGWLAIAPLQDVLELGSEARMNRPSVAAGNWTWRVRRKQLTEDLAARLRELASRSGRAG
jgi:4-alpha-glucanotransferase